MGLGKTFQVASFIHTLCQRGQAKRILIVAPKTLLGAWEKEVSEELGMDLVVYGGKQRATSRDERLAIMDRIARQGGILMMTYGLIQRDAGIVRTHTLHDTDEGPFWDVMVMDEGHTLKNRGNKTRVEIERVGARMRLLITGTPIQNNLMELHSLFDLVKEGLLGDKVEFKDTFERPIKRGTSKDATRREQDAGVMASVSLQKTYAPFMLRRTKDAVMGMAASREGSGRSGGSGGEENCVPAWKKKDIVVWLRLTEMQLGLYKAFLRSKSVRQVLQGNRSALASLTVLKKICKHPALLSDDLSVAVRCSGGPKKIPDGAHPEDVFLGDREELRELRESTEWQQTLQAHNEQQKPDAVSASCKTLFVMGLLDRLIATGHRSLVFSESKVMLNILEEAIAARRWKYLRIDGDIDGAERSARVTRFQEDDSYPVFLLTSQVGGLGLTLTGADRVILCDPSWNPSVDNQSVDRACRLGQTRDVLVYRLVTCGTIEDKVYQKQVFKGAIFKAGTEQGEQQRYFSESETQVVIMQDLFTLAPEEFQHSSTQKQLEARHRHQRNTPPAIQKEIDALGGIESYVGISDHDLLYSEVSEISENIIGQAQIFQSATTPQGKSNGRACHGDDQLAAMFDKALSLKTTSSPSTSAPITKSEALRLQIQEDLEKQEKLLGNSVLLAALPDGGSRIRATVQKLELQLQQLEVADVLNDTDDTGVSEPSHGVSPPPSSSSPPPNIDLLDVVHREVNEPTPFSKVKSDDLIARTTVAQEQTLVLKARMKRAKADLHRKAKELEAYRLGTHVKLDEDARLKAEVERLLDEFSRAKTAWEKACS